MSVFVINMTGNRQVAKQVHGMTEQPPGGSFVTVKIMVDRAATQPTAAKEQRADLAKSTVVVGPGRVETVQGDYGSDLRA